MTLKQLLLYLFNHISTICFSQTTQTQNTLPSPQNNRDDAIFISLTTVLAGDFFFPFFVPLFPSEKHSVRCIFTLFESFSMCDFMRKFFHEPK